MKEKPSEKDTVEAAQRTFPEEARAFWDEVAERIELETNEQTKLVEPR